MVNLSTINAQKETMTCNEILSFTTIINRTIEIENNEISIFHVTSSTAPQLNLQLFFNSLLRNQ